MFKGNFGEGDNADNLLSTPTTEAAALPTGANSVNCSPLKESPATNVPKKSDSLVTFSPVITYYPEMSYETNATPIEAAASPTETNAMGFIPNQECPIGSAAEYEGEEPKMMPQFNPCDSSDNDSDIVTPDELPYIHVPREKVRDSWQNVVMQQQEKAELEI